VCRLAAVSTAQTADLTANDVDSYIIKNTELSLAESQSRDQHQKQMSTSSGTHNSE